MQRIEASCFGFGGMYHHHHGHALLQVAASDCVIARNSKHGVLTAVDATMRITLNRSRLKLNRSNTGDGGFAARTRGTVEAAARCSLRREE